jgi:hypothetical protein
MSQFDFLARLKESINGTIIWTEIAAILLLRSK